MMLLFLDERSFERLVVPSIPGTAKRFFAFAITGEYNLTLLTTIQTLQPAPSRPF